MEQALLAICGRPTVCGLVNGGLVLVAAENSAHAKVDIQAVTTNVVFWKKLIFPPDTTLDLINRMYEIEVDLLRYD